jgi:hypothetical protein
MSSVYLYNGYKVAHYLLKHDEDSKEQRQQLRCAPVAATANTQYIQTICIASQNGGNVYTLMYTNTLLYLQHVVARTRRL